MSRQIEECIDCNWYDNVLEGDSFLRPFGDSAYLCALCAENRGIDAAEWVR